MCASCGLVPVAALVYKFERKETTEQVANHCCVCDRRWPPEPVIMIVLGDEWLEFCAECQDTPDFFTNGETEQKATPRQLFEMLDGEPSGGSDNQV